MTLVPMALLVGSSWTLGIAATSRLDWPDQRPYERLALRLTAGLGLTALALSLLALGGWFSHATLFLGALSAASGIVIISRARNAHRRTRPLLPALVPGIRVTSLAVWGCVALACLGAIAPVTDDDALAYVVPIARHLADTGEIAVWTDQARSMWPQSQQVLLAYLISAGSDRLGALTALEWLLLAGVVSALARRVCDKGEHIGPAMILALGAPVLAFQVASAKEDLLLVAASTAAAFSLAGRGARGELAAAGLFAGIAAGAKYPGVGVVLAAVAWPIVSRRERALRDAAVVALCAAVGGGLWYGLNIWRYGNPVAPFVFGARGTTLDANIVNAFLDGYGVGRNLLTFVAAPAWIFADPSQFCGRANLYNPLVYASLAGLLAPAARHRHAPLYFMAAVLYVGWFLTLQNARLLLPGAVLLAPAAADQLFPLVRRHRGRAVLACGAAAVSLGVVAAVGIVRASRYVDDASTFLARETQNYEDVLWMNTHLNRQRDRVASDHKALAYLDVPWIFLASNYQIEISESELNDSVQLLGALRRQRITHLFGSADSFLSLRPRLRVLHRNPSSRLGGVRFFREPPTEGTAVFEIVYDSDAAEVSGTKGDGR